MQDSGLYRLLVDPVALVHANKMCEPSSFEEAYKKKEWKDEMIEFNSILKNDVWVTD